MNTLRPPVVAVLGHVDHGKTTLLDYIRRTSVAAGEFGGITQHIGAYEIMTKEGKPITFIDTPGHEAFTNLRKRGVMIADVALLVVAADSSVQPQTVEALHVIQESKTPFIVVINKVDLPDIRIEKVIKDLTKHNVILEGRGGDIPYVELSAKTGNGVPALLELITLFSELQNNTYDDTGEVLGMSVEVKKDRRGIVVTVILKNGTLHVGDDVYMGEEKIRVKALFDVTGVALKEVVPSTPVVLLGCTNMVAAGTLLTAQKGVIPVSSAPVAAPVDFKTDFYAAIKKQFNFIIKCDASGTEEVIREKLGAYEEIKIVKCDIGEPTEADVEFAKAVKANILAFNVKVRKEVEKKADIEGVSIFSYTLIYELLDQMEELIRNLRVKEEKESRKIGEAKILAEFVKGPVKIAGMRIMAGKIRANCVAELLRGKKNLGETTIKSLFQKTSAVVEVKKGEECGALFSTQLDFKPGDIVKLYTP